MRFDNIATLAAHLQLPHRENIPFGDLMTPDDIRPAVSESKSALAGSMPNPDYEAVEFYALNQIMAQLQQQYSMTEQLPLWAQEVAEAYAKCLADQTLRMCHYVLLITTRESRHLRYKEQFFVEASKGLNAPKQFKEFMEHISGSGSDAAVQRFCASAPKGMSLTEYMKWITDVFNKGSFSGGYGGKPWGNIADTLYRYVGGKTSAEVFLDTAYTLAHNNGPIFNKGMYYHHYTHNLKIILDVQRSGQVCEMVMDPIIKYLTHINSHAGYAMLKQHVAAAAKHLDFPTHVDWFKVEALGSLQKYPTDKANQEKKWGKPGSEVAKKAVAPKLQLIDGLPVKITGEFEVFPGVKAPIYIRLNKEVTA